MKAITLWQPWAQLVAIGAKTIETRSWGTRYRGPLAIHAAKTLEGIDSLPGDCEGNTEGDWVYGYIGDYQASYCRRASDEGHRGDTQLVNVTAGEGVDVDTPMPLGAVVATARLVDCVPMIGERQSTIDTPVGSWLFVPPDRDHLVYERSDGVHLRDVPITGQRPYGDFQPGRWAWLLADVHALPEPIPARGRQQLFDVDLHA